MEKERIDVLLVKKGFVKTRSKAVQLIKDGCVFVDNKSINKSSFLIDENTNIIIKDSNVLNYVSRGGLKLKKAIDYFNLNLKDKVVLDIGASTGGFCDCSLQHGANHIYAIDVGSDQLDLKLKEDIRVTSYENTNFKDVDHSFFDKKIDFITIDVSFISLRPIFIKINTLFNDVSVMALFKPQFEVGKKNISKNGVVKDKNAHLTGLIEFNEFLNSLGYFINNFTFSPITGGKEGNIEYLCLISKNKTQNYNFNKTINEAFNTLRGK